MIRLMWIALVLIPGMAWAQSAYAPLNEEYYHKIDRYEVKMGRIYPQIFTSVKQYQRSAIVDFIDSVGQNGAFRSKSDRFNRNFLRNDSWECVSADSGNSRRPILKYFYRNQSDLVHVHNRDFDLHVNPVLYWGLGQDSRRTDRLYTNTRGVEVRGTIDEKVSFYTYLTDNQMLLPQYVSDQMKYNPVVPHEGFWKTYKNGNGVDFLQARGYINVNATKHITVQLGNDRNFIGNGYRSLILSDYAPPALFFKANVKVWKINYLYMIQRMTGAVNAQNGTLLAGKRYPEKFLAFHHLSMNIGRKLNFGVFESVIFSPRDSVSNHTFEWSYVNPIIFYRAVEQQDGSSDNVVLGADFKWNLIKKVSLYGQLVLDEFVLKHIKAGDGWWANKYAIQGGLKYIDAFGVSNLDLQGEVNIVRPFTYSHNTQFGSYTSYQQPLAHPLGANFNEVVGILRYQPFPRFSFTGKLIVAKIGRDNPAVINQDFGSNPLINNNYRSSEFNNKIGQGNLNKLTIASATLSYMFRHNLFIDGSVFIRKSTCPVAYYNNNSTITSLALRWNIPQRLYEF